MTSPQVYYTEDVEQFANYDFLMVFDAAACPENQTVLCFKVGKDKASRSLLMLSHEEEVNALFHF